MPTSQKREAKPQAKVGDVVFAEGSWWQVRNKRGQRIQGQLLLRPDLPEHRFTSRQVERVFREMGRRRQKAQAEA